MGTGGGGTTRSWEDLAPASRAVAVEVLLHGPLSRSEIARRLLLSAGSLTRLATPLIEAGLLYEVEQPHLTPSGRQGRGLQVVADVHHFVGVRLTGEELSAVLTDMRGGVVATTRAPLPDHRPDHVVATVTAAVEELARTAAVAAAGVSLGGNVRPDGSIQRAVFLEWSEVPLAGLLEARLGLPVHVENDVVALTTVEHWFDRGRGHQDMAVITVGTGIGSGLVVHGRVVSHLDSGVGLLGHLLLGLPGPVCDQGHRGCAALLSDGSLVNQVSVALGRRLDRDELVALVAAGTVEPAVDRICDDFATGLGRLVAIVANATQVPYVLVSGEGVDLAVLLEDRVRAEVAACRDPAASPLQVDLQPLATEQWARGAAAVAIQRFVSRNGKA